MRGVVADSSAQGRLALDWIEGFVAATPDLRGAVEVQAARAVFLASVSTLTVPPADQAGTWGLRPDLIVIDELAQWPQTVAARRLLDAALTALTKRPGARC